VLPHNNGLTHELIPRKSLNVIPLTISQFASQRHITDLHQADHFSALLGWLIVQRSPTGFHRL
jgi:hypothetical protein